MGIEIRDLVWALGFGIGIGDWIWELGIMIGDLGLGLRLGSGIGDWGSGFPVGGGKGGTQCIGPLFLPFGDLSPPRYLPPSLESVSPPSKKFSRCARINTVFQVLRIKIILDHIQSPTEHIGVQATVI